MFSITLLLRTYGIPYDAQSLKAIRDDLSSFTVIINFTLFSVYKTFAEWRLFDTSNKSA